jgi:hypothetical protein
VTIESVAGQLRTLRTRIENQKANQHSWPTKEEELAADIDRYDRRLLKAAAMLQVPAPASKRREEFLLSEAERLLLEKRLADSGLDVRASADDQTQA